MKWFRRDRSVEARAIDHQDFFGRPLEGPARVTHDAAAGLAPIFAAVRCVSESMSSLSVNVVKDGKRVRGHWLERLLDAPNPAQSRMEFLETMISAFELRGNAFAEVVRGPDGRPGALWPMRPGIVRPERRGADVVYHVATKDGQVTVGADRILHWRFGVLSPDGITGTDPVKLLHADISAAANARDFAANFFANGAAPSGVLSHPATLGDKAAENLRRQFQGRNAGSRNAGKVLLLEEGMSWAATSIDPEKSQLVESRTFGIQDIARVWSLPPHKLGDHSRSTFSNITEEAASFVKNSIRPRCVRLEQSTNRQLLSPDERAAGISLQFNLDSLLRGSTTERYAAHAVGINAGFISRNEARRMEDFEPVEGLDEMLLLPGQQTQATQAEENKPNAETN